MPLEVHILQNGAGRVWICRGVVLGSEFIQNNERVLSTKSYEGVRWLLIDETNCTLTISPEDLRIIKAQDDHIATLLPELVTAIVVPHDYAFGMTRMWEALTERPGWSTRAFRLRRDAEEWLRDEVRRKFAMELPETISP
jgi:hypothetical protein